MLAIFQILLNLRYSENGNDTLEDTKVYLVLNIGMELCASLKSCLHLAFIHSISLFWLHAVIQGARHVPRSRTRD